MSAVNDWCGANCPIDCDDALFQVPDFGCETPNNDLITEVFYSNTPLATGTLSEWNSRLSNSAANTTGTIRSIGVIASLPRVEPTFKTTKKGASVPLEVEREITFNIEDDKDFTFQFYQKIQCGITKNFWFRSGGHIYGGLTGIYGTLTASYEINEAAEGMAHNWESKLKFKSKCFPDRVAAVI